MERTNMEEREFTAETSEDLETDVAVEESTTDNTASEEQKPTDSDSQNATEQTSVKKEQSKEENSAFARARREREQAEKLEKARAEAAQEERERAIMEYVKTNPYTNKPISNSHDVEQYLRMKRIDEAGGDPLNDYADEIDREHRENARRKAKEEDDQKRIDEDISAFRKAYPNVDLTKLLNDPAFSQMCKDKIGETPLTELYKTYTNFVEGIRKEEKNKLIAETAIRKSGVGSAESTGKTEAMTKGQFRKMTLDQRAKLLKENPSLYKQLKT